MIFMNMMNHYLFCDFFYYYMRCTVSLSFIHSAFYIYFFVSIIDFSINYSSAHDFIKVERKILNKILNIIIIYIVYMIIFQFFSFILKRVFFLMVTQYISNLIGINKIRNSIIKKILN